MNLTIRDIAKLAGVSPATVSKIMNNYDGVSNVTKRKVLDIISETGYQPTFSAKALATKKSNLIGLIYAGEINVDFSHPFFNSVVSAFQKAIGLLGYDILIFTNENFDKENGSSYLARCRHFHVDGCLIIAGEEIEQAVHELVNSEVPCVGVDLPIVGEKSTYVMTDNTKVSANVIEYFYLNSIKEIGYIGGKENSTIASIRTAGFIQSMEQFGLEVNKDWIAYGNFEEDSGYEAMKSILKAKELPKAVFAASDKMALGAIKAIREEGLSVPIDMRIIGCDDIEACRYSDPPLSTVKQDKEKLGKLAAYMLNDLINGATELKSVLVDPELVIRKS